MELDILITEIKNFMLENPTLFEKDKIEAFNDMSNPINSDLSKEDSITVLGNVNLVYEELVRQSDPDYGDEFNERFNKKDIKRLSTIYLLLLKKDKSVALSIDGSDLYCVLNGLRGLEYSKYNEAIEEIKKQNEGNLKNTPDNFKK